MKLKKKLGMGIASAVLGLSLVGGGTFAYFSDEATQTNGFTSGTIELDVDSTVQLPMDKLKPGDTMEHSFELKNNGSLDISKVLPEIDYTVRYDDEKGSLVPKELANKFAEQIQVKLLGNPYGNEEYLFNITLKELSELNVEELAKYYEDELKEVTGLEVGDTKEFDVEFKFNDTGEPQNDLQGLDLKLEWTFEGHQTEGEEK